MVGEKNIGLLTYNVRGLRDPRKRGKTFNFIRSMNCEIICLQETHSDASVLNAWNSELKDFECFWNSLTSRRGGTAVLVKKTAEFKVIETQLLHEGRTIISDIDMGCDEFKKTIIVNIYAPADGSRERLSYFEKLDKAIETKILNSGDSVKLILTGDFNCVTNQKDKSSVFDLAKDKSSQTLLNLMSKYGLTDAWRKIKKKKKQYTWRQIDKNNENRNVACRLDRWLVHDPLIANVHKCNILPSVISDHLPVVIRLYPLSGVKRGKGIWKLNNSLLRDENFKGKIRRMWAEHRKIRPTSEKEILAWWDLGKIKIKNIAIQRSKELNAIKKNEHKQLLDQLKTVMDEYDKSPSCTTSQRIDNIKATITNIENQQLEGIKIRSRVKWYEEGEKSTKYFLKLENSRGKSKTFSSIKKGDGTTTTEIYEILDTQVDFYRELYTEKQTDKDAQNFFLSNITKNLNEDEKKICEGDITLNEMDKAIKSFQNDKSPGSDGLSKEFYDCFWDILREDLQLTLNSAMICGNLSESQSEAIITLLYKNGERDDIKNWRPISLLNLDYKILTKCIASRIRKVIDVIIGKHQTCGVPGRSIFENIIFSQDAIFFANKYNKPLAIVSIDQSKAFDRVNRPFMLKCLKKFGFGDSLIKWISVIYKRTTSRIITNGFLSEPFELTRGVRQGCPLSPILYIIVAETLALAISKNRKIKGFILPDGTESKVSAYADDTNLYLSDIESIKELIRILNLYEKATESKLNLDKTMVLLSVNLRGSENEVKDLGLKIADRLKVLGVWVGNDDMSKENWNPLLSKVKKVLNLWSLRDLTVYGKVQVIKSLALSKLWYVATVTVPPTEVLDDIKKAVWDFIWSKKREAVSRKKCYSPVSCGGLGMFDIQAKCCSLKLKWLAQLLSKEKISDATKLGTFFLENFDKSFNSIQVITTHLKNVKNDHVPKLYVELLDTWRSLDIKRKIPDNLEVLLEEYIWLNPEMKYNNSVLYNPVWIQSGIKKLKDVWNRTTNTWIDLQTLLSKFPVFFQRNPMSVREMFRKIKASVENNPFCEALKKINFNQVDVNSSNLVVLWYGKESKEFSSKRLYEMFVEKIHNFGNEFCTDKFWWCKLMKSDLDRKIMQLLWKIYHQALPLGDKLKTWFPNEEDGMCAFCKNNEENTNHLFVECPFVQNFLRDVCRNFGIHNPLDNQGLGINWCDTVNKRQFYILGLCKKVIWDLRNNCKFKNLPIDARSFHFNFKYMLKSHLENLYNVHFYKKKEDVFIETYINGNDICSLNQFKRGKIEVKLI